MQRYLVFFCAVFLASFAQAEQVVTLLLKSSHEFAAFESPDWPLKDVNEFVKMSGESAKFTMKARDNKSRLCLIDRDTGDFAAKNLTELETGTWPVVDSNFVGVHKLIVEVLAPGGPVDSATVELQEGGTKRQELIAPASKGQAVFWFVKFGELSVTVNYRGKSGMAAPVKQSFTLAMKRDSVVPILKVALPEGNSSDVGAGAAVNNAPADKKATEPQTQAAAPPTATGNIFSTLAGLAVVAAAIYFILKYLRENSDKVQETMKKLGADIPQPGGNSDPDPAPVQPIAPQPMQQIILDGASVPDAVGPIAMPIANVATVSGAPKLIASDGSSFEVPEGETVVGREFGNGLVVPNDTVSRRHASIQKSGSMVTVSDHGSTNGTWVNGMAVSTWTPLSPGDAVRFGSVEYRFEG